MVAGDKVEVMQTSGSWVFIKGNGVKGWVAAEYLSSPEP
ncbi:bacterial SH3 domain protein [Vibrio parahaemolyticus 50]|nr:bacterial SH3 domain protein [Vibrio parahaemolyticus 50]